MKWFITITLILAANSIQEEVAGNLNPLNDDQNTVDSNIASGNNESKAFVEDTVRIVRAPGSYGLDGETPGRPAEESAESKEDSPPVKRAPPPVGVAESVGFVPQPEDKKPEDEVKPTIEKDQTVRLIPTLPPR